MEKINNLKKGEEGLGVKWLQQQLQLNVDGIFGAKTEGAVRRFQSRRNLAVDGIAGEKTCRTLGMTGFAVFPVKDNFYLISDIDQGGKTLRWHDYCAPATQDFKRVITAEKSRGYWRIADGIQRKGYYNWYAYKGYVSIVEGYGTMEKRGESRWEQALLLCPTNGASKATASQDGLTYGGVQASERMAQTDKKLFREEYRPVVRKIAEQYDIPGACLMAIASRESRMGGALGKNGCDPGWGDNNHAFGVFQIDIRHHSVNVEESPWAESHIRQAAEILYDYRVQLQKKHSTWSDPNILKGMCVAYNAGASNVRTIERMDIGTTGDDYGSDVIARAKYYQKNL